MEFLHFSVILRKTETMFKNYLKIGWRNITRNKFYAGVNIIGLSLGIGACLVIYLIISYELGFDHFHPGRQRIYRLMGDITENTGDKLHFARIPAAVAPSMRAEISGIEEVASFIPYAARVTIPGINKQFDSRIEGTHFITTVIAEPKYFSIFKYDWLAGDAALALDAPLSVVLTEGRAQQYFGAGRPEDFLGRQLIYEDSLQVTVTGIIRQPESNTDLAFTDYISYASIQGSWLKGSIRLDSWSQRDMAAWTFVKLAPGSTSARAGAQLAGLMRRHSDPQTKLALWLEPLSRMHFNDDIVENPIRTAHMPTLYSMMAVALFILLLAVINFINLSTALSIRRAREIGVRKVLGGTRMSLAIQFVIETSVLTLFASLLGLLWIKPALFVFRSFVPEGVVFHFFSFSTFIILGGTILVTTILASLYPARVLSSYLPALSLKAAGAAGGDHSLLRKGLIVFQFTVSLVFIIGSMVISRQLKYARDIDPGFNADAILIVDGPGGDSLSKVRVLAEKFRKIPGIDQVALEWVPPMTDNTRGMRLKVSPADSKEWGVTQVAGNENFIPLYRIHLLAGRNLRASDSVREFVINESLSRVLGNKTPDQALGKTYYWNDRPYPVVGVVADFHTSSLHDPITPLCIINRTERQGAIAIKLASPGKGSAPLAAMQKAWKLIYPDKVFNFRFYDESLAMLYEKDRKTAVLINTSMVIAILISCIGLFGLALFSAEKRAKEISIRKILGATIGNIAYLLCRDFLLLVIVALFIASPVAWHLMNRWLRGFAYHIDIQVWTFIAAGAFAVFIALVTVGYQSVKAALANPIKDLRSE
jgi:hypothetical protein